MKGEEVGLVLRRGEARETGFALDVTPQRAGWERSGLRVVELAPGERVRLLTGDSEFVVVPLAGAATVSVDQHTFELDGRSDVFAGPTDVVYAPRDADLEVLSSSGGRFALCSAVCGERLTPVHLAASEVPVERRGAGRSSRIVHNFGVPGVLEADRIIACEVLTPGGNWSSWPPHKHDVEREGETQLEEIYYYEIAEGPGGPGLGYQRVYGHEAAAIDVAAEVRTGDVVLIPHGWHGPSIAAPGHDMYYLNVMAGSGPERAWLICDDPEHAWVRGLWQEQTWDAPIVGHADDTRGGGR